MKKLTLILMASAAVIGAQAGVITPGSTWTAYTPGDTPPVLSNQSSTGFDLTAAGGSSSAQRAVYQTGLSGGAFGIGQTAVLSFTVTTLTAPTDENIAVSFSIWDDVNNDGFSGKVDYGTPAGECFRIGYDKAMAFNRIGTDAQGRVAGSAPADASSTPLDSLGASSDITLSVTRNGLDDYSLTVDWDDVSLTSDLSGNDMGSLTAIDAVGIRWNSKNAGAFTVSNLSMEVIPEPATFGLFALVGGVMLAARRICRK